MTRNPLTIGAEASPRKASDLMRKEGIHHLPVVRGGGRLIGILTDRDLRHAALMPALAGRMPWDVQRLKAPRVRDVMTWVVVTTGPEATLVEAGLVMIERRIGSLPVVERDRLVGILTEHDLLKALRADTSTDSDAGSDADGPALEAKECLP